MVRAGSYTESLRVKVKDLHGKEAATLGQFSDKAKIKLQVVLKKAKKTAKRVVKSAKKAAKRLKRR